MLKVFFEVITILCITTMVSCVTHHISDRATDLARLVSDCTNSEDTHSSASGSGSIDSPDNTSTACDTMDIVLHTDLQLDFPVTFHNLTYTSIQGANRTMTLTCTSTGAGLVFSNTQHVEMNSLVLVNCAVVRNYSNLDFYQAFSSAMHIVESQHVLMNSVSIVDSLGTGLLLLYAGGMVNITACHFTANNLPEKQLYGGGGVYLHTGPTQPDSQFHFTNCTFAHNIADNSPNYTYLFVDEDGDSISGRGRGGGMFVNLRRHTVNSSTTITGCSFINNTGFLGSGLSAEIEHERARGNSISVRDTVFEQNGCLEGDGGGVGSGGGVQLSYRTGRAQNTNRDNTMQFHNVTFIANCALLGGGVYFFSSLQTDLSINNQLVFNNCTWEGNTANTGSAVDLTPDIFEHLDSGYPMVPVFKDCAFVRNTIEAFSGTSTDHRQHSGIGTLYSSLYDIKFVSSAKFLRNFGTAVHVVNAVADFTNSSALFDGNEGSEGGGVALIGTSSLLIGPNNYTFTNNVATARGGAIYSYLVDNHDFVVSRSCFLQYIEEVQASRIPTTQIGIPSDQWKARVLFDGNRAGSGQGHDIFTTSLLPCQVVRNNSEFKVLQLTGIFKEPAVTFPGEIDGWRISTDGADFSGNTGHLEVVPGEQLSHGVCVLDDLDQPIVSMLSATFPTNRSSIELDDSTFLTDQAIHVRGRPHEEDTLVLQAVNARKISLAVDVEMLECPPGFVFSDDRCVCDALSHVALVRCSDANSYLRVGFWAGYLNDTRKEEVFSSAVCPLGFCNYDSNGSKLSPLEVPLPNSREELEEIVCGAERSGVLCGRCNPGYAVRYHSPSLQCVAEEDYCNSLGWLFYLLSEILPATVLFIVVLVFNISFTSGALNGFILFSQVLDTLLIDASGVIVLPKSTQNAIDAIRLVYSFFNLDFFYLQGLSFCIWKGASALDVLAFKYLTVFYSVLLIAGVVIFMKHCGARCLGKYYRVSVMKSSVIQGLSTFLVMCYAQCVKVSFSLLYSGTLYLSPAEANSSVHKRVWYNGDIEYFSPRHLPYALPALAVLLTIGVIPPVILLTYPAIFRVLRALKVPDSYTDKCLLPFNTLKPFLDAFQGSFRDDVRFFAGVYFLYRWVGVLIFAASANYSIFYPVLEMVLILIVMLHALTLPYHRMWHNILDTFILADLALINTLTTKHYFTSQVNGGQSNQLGTSWSNILQVILVYAPAVYLLAYVSFETSTKMCCKDVSIEEKCLAPLRARFTKPTNDEEQSRDIDIPERDGDLPYRMVDRKNSTAVVTIENMATERDS